MRRSFSIFGRFVSVALLCVVMSCARLPYVGNRQSDYERGLGLSIEDARVFFKSHNDKLTLLNSDDVTRSGVVDIKDLLSWENASYTTLWGKDVVEVPFERVGFSIDFYRDTRNTDSDDADGSTPKLGQSNTQVKLIAGLNEVGEIYYRLIYLTPDRAFLDANALSVGKFTLADVGYAYSGAVRYYTVEGELIEGYIYHEGEQHYSISSGDNVSTRAAEGSDGDEPIMSRSSVQVECHYAWVRNEFVYYYINHSYNTDGVYTEYASRDSWTSITYKLEWVCAMRKV